MTTGAPQAAEIAHAMSECMNLLFLFSAPRVLESVRGTGLVGLEATATAGALRRFLRHASAIRARAASGGAVSDDVERLVQSAMLVEEMVGKLTTAPEGGPLPAPVVDKARRALDILGMPEPQGGWDAFEGFAVPNLPLPRPSDPRG